MKKIYALILALTLAGASKQSFAQLTASISSNTSPTCNGQCDGTAVASATGGVTPYTYLWTGGQNTSTATGLCAGNYTITVTAADSTIATASITITQPSVLYATADADAAICLGNNIVIGVFASGGTPNYTYIWSPGGMTTSNITVSPTSTTTYTVNVTDANGCSATDNVIVTVNALPIANAGADQSTCPGSDTVFFSGSGGVSYSWTFGGGTPATSTSQSPSVTFGSPGTYTASLMVTDAGGCSATDNAMVTVFSAPSVTVSPTNPNCFGGSDGTATATASGGATPYSYLWATGAITQTATGLPAGNYTVSVTDANGCTATAIATITEPALFSASGTMVTSYVSCNGGNNGSATLIASGGTGGYTYLWSTGSTSQNTTGLAAGNYTGTVTDANGCTAIGSVTITQPAANVASISKTNVSCNGCADGIAIVSVSGGTPPYTYLWSDSATTDTIINLIAGTYSVVATDANGCTANSSVIITQPAPGLSASVTSNNASCGNCNGSASVSASGGTTPYTYQWSNSSTTSTINGLCAGTYFITVTDNDSTPAQTVDSIIITNTNGPSVTVSATNTSCSGCSDGWDSAYVSGGTPPYAYQWSNGATTPNISGLVAGNYSVTVTDANGCSANGSATVSDPPGNPPTAAFTASNNIICLGATINFSDSSTGNPTSWSWNFGDGNSSTLQNPSNTYSVAGTYNVTLTAANAYGSDTVSSSITVNPLPSVNAGSDANICTGDPLTLTGSGAISYQWSNGASSAAITVNPSSSSVFSVTGTDASGCTNTDSLLITVNPNPAANALVINNVFCNGGSNGALTANATGGTLPYTFIWTNGSASDTAAGLPAGSYDVTVTDANGCLAQSTNIISEPTIMAASTSANASTCGQSNGSATVTASGGTSPYTYLWSTSETTTSIAGKASGAYSVITTDANGCQRVEVASISDLSGPSVTILTIVNANCGGPDGSATISVSGGTSPLNYLWSNGAVSVNLDTVPPGIYSIEVTDTNGCKGVASATIGNNGNNAPSISGTVKVDNNNFTVTAGMVYVYKKISTPGQFPPIASASIDGNGNYLFTTILPIGEYLIKAEADTTLPAYQFTIPTYYTLTYKWDSATLVNAVCDSAYLIDLRIIDLQPMNGTSDLNGVVIADGTGKVSGFDLIMGDPIPGIDISLEQIPGGIVARGETGNDGTFSFTNVPLGNYKLYVDIPGLPMDTTYDVNLVSNDSTVNDLNFLVGDSSIYIPDAVGVKEFQWPGLGFRLYPNPVTNEITLSVSLPLETNVKVLVTNSLGQETPLFNGKTSKGETEMKFDTENLPDGVYFLRVIAGENTRSLPRGMRFVKAK